MVKWFRYAASLIVLTSVVTPSSAAGIGVVGNNVEFYGENLSCSSLQTNCTMTFPANGTGKVVRIENVTCEVIVTNTGTLLNAAVGPAATPGGAFLKRSWFPLRHLANNGSFPIYSIASEPRLLLGANRYLQVVVTATQALSAVQCSASGVFTP